MGQRNVSEKHIIFPPKCLTLTAILERERKKLGDSPHRKFLPLKSNVTHLLPHIHHEDGRDRPKFGNSNSCRQTRGLRNYEKKVPMQMTRNFICVKMVLLRNVLVVVAIFSPSLLGQHFYIHEIT